MSKKDGLKRFFQEKFNVDFAILSFRQCFLQMEIKFSVPFNEHILPLCIKEVNLQCHKKTKTI